MMNSGLIIIFMHIKTITSHLPRDQKQTRSLHFESPNFRKRNHRNYAKLTNYTYHNASVYQKTQSNLASVDEAPAADWCAEQLKFRLGKTRQEYKAKRQIIKQKIKGRVKEQLADLIRRNAFHQHSLKAEEGLKQRVEYSSSIVVKSKFSPVIKQLAYRSDLIESMKNSCKIGSVLLQQNPANIRIKNKRCWSSTVKVRNPNQHIPKRSIYSRMSNQNLATNKQILQIHTGNQIQPWINFQDDIQEL